MPEEFPIETLTRMRFEPMLDCAQCLFDESNFNGVLTASRPKYRMLLERNIAHPGAKAFIAMDNEFVVGYILIYCQNDYTEEMIGEMFQFYVRPEYRGSMVARSLIKRACQQWDEWGCVRTYAEASPGFTDIQHLMLFKNLWRKFNFEQVGIIMLRDKK